MRFFRSFKLLHRRTKSDPLIGNISGANAAGHQRTASSGFTDISTAFLTALPDYEARDIHPASHLSIRIFDLEVENARLRQKFSDSVNELSQLRSQLKASRAELFAELYRGVRQAKEDRIETQRLRDILAQYERLLQDVITTSSPPDVAIARLASSDGRPTNQRLEVAVDQGITAGTEASCTKIIPSAFGSRTQGEYMSALNLTLKSRMELRQWRKVAKFWRSVAKKDGQHPDVVTPSNSSISSIRETLPIERQKAVDALKAKRRNEALDQSRTANVHACGTPVHAIKTKIDLAGFSNPALDSTCMSTSLSFCEPHALPYKACLSPLASHSLKQELSKMSSAYRLPKWPSGRRILGQVDLNVDKEAYTLPLSTASRAKLVKPISVSRRNASGDLSLHCELKNEPRALKTASSEKPTTESENVHLNSHQDRPLQIHEFLRTTSSSENSDTSLPLCVLDLSNIMEESELPYATLSADDTFEEWVTCGFPREQDVSFGSTADTLFPTTPTTSTTPARKTDISVHQADSPKSRLPLPVFQKLRGFSLTKRSTTREKGVLVGPITKLVTKPAPTRLPVRSNTSFAVK